MPYLPIPHQRNLLCIFCVDFCKSRPSSIASSFIGRLLARAISVEAIRQVDIFNAFCQSQGWTTEQVFMSQILNWSKSSRTQLTETEKSSKHSRPGDLISLDDFLKDKTFSGLSRLKNFRGSNNQNLSRSLRLCALTF